MAGAKAKKFTIILAHASGECERQAEIRSCGSRSSNRLDLGDLTGGVQ